MEGPLAQRGQRRAVVKTKLIVLIALGAVLVAGVWLLFLKSAPSLPRIRFSDGGEFRVVKVCYGTENDHYVGGAPASFFWAWGHLPKRLQGFIPYPNTGARGMSPFTNAWAISVFWGYIDPRTQKSEIGSTDYVMTTLDSGERLGRIWSEPATNDHGDEYRQIFLNDPPRHSKHLRFELGVEDQRVDFSILNPAFKKSAVKAQSGVGSGDSRIFPPVEIPIRRQGDEQGSPGLSVRFPESISVQRNAEVFEFEYSIRNLFTADVFVAVHPEDDIANSFSAFHSSVNADQLRYALVSRPNGNGENRITHSATRKALMVLRNPLESGGRFNLCVYVEGYFRDTGQPFYGATNIDLPVSIVD